MDNKKMYESGRKYNFEAVERIAGYALEKLKHELKLEQSDVDAIMHGDDWPKMMAFQKMWAAEMDSMYDFLSDPETRKTLKKLLDEAEETQRNAGIRTTKDTDSDGDNENCNEAKTYARDADMFYFMKKYVEGIAFERFKNNSLVQEFKDQFLGALEEFGNGEVFGEVHSFEFSSYFPGGSSVTRVTLGFDSLEVSSYGFADWSYSINSDGTGDGEAHLETIESELNACVNDFLSINKPGEYSFDEYANKEEYEEVMNAFENFIREIQRSGSNPAEAMKRKYLADFLVDLEKFKNEERFDVSYIFEYIDGYSGGHSDISVEMDADHLKITRGGYDEGDSYTNWICTLEHNKHIEIAFGDVDSVVYSLDDFCFGEDLSSLIITKPDLGEKDKLNSGKEE